MVPINPESPGISSLLGKLNDNSNSKMPDKSDVKFSDTLGEFIEDVNSLQNESAEKTESFIKGEPVDIHDVMISSQKAKTSFELLIELRNKALDLYKEVNRMQV